MRPDVRAAYDLCLYLHEPHPDHLLAKLTARQWKGWLAYLSKFPLPHDRHDINVARQRWDFRAVNGVSEAVADLIPQYGQVDEEPVPQTEAQLKAKVAAHFAAKEQARKRAGG